MDPIFVLVWCVVLIVIGVTAHLIITKFFPPEVHMPALLVVGVVLLLVLLVYVVGWPPRHLRALP